MIFWDRNGCARFYQTQITALQEQAKSQELGSDEWVTTMTNLATIEEQYRKLHPKMEIKDVISAIGTLGTLAIGGTGLALTWETAKLAYTSDEEMKSKNGNIWQIKNGYKDYYKSK